MSQLYQVIIEVDDSAQCHDFESWLLAHQANVLAISENSGCGCCVHIYTLLVAEGVQVLPIFNVAQKDDQEVLYEGAQKETIIQTYLGASSS